MSAPNDAELLSMKAKSSTREECGVRAREKRNTFGYINGSESSRGALLAACCVSVCISISSQETSTSSSTICSTFHPGSREPGAGSRELANYLALFHKSPTNYLRNTPQRKKN